MATSRYFVCKKCSNRKRVSRLFDALKHIADGTATNCPSCGSRCDLQLKFWFGLDRGAYEYIVASSYLPDKITTWPDANGCKVEFFPFLVILQGTQHTEIAAWLPYWHLHHQPSKVRAKYGQWAALMKIQTYKQLQAKAHKDGYL